MSSGILENLTHQAHAMLDQEREEAELRSAVDLSQACRITSRLNACSLGLHAPSNEFDGATTVLQA